MSDTNENDAGVSLFCPRHPHESATAICFDCEAPLCSRCLTRDKEGLALCPRCASDFSETHHPTPKPAHSPAEVVEAYQAQLNPQEVLLPELLTVPWESSEPMSDISAFSSSVYFALTHPIRFMAAAGQSRGDMVTPTIFALVAALIGQASVTAQLLMDPQPIPMPPLVTAQLGGVSVKALMLALLPIFPVLIAFALMAKSVLAHAILGFFGKRASPFESTLRIFAYAEVASILLFLPGVGIYAEKFLAVFLVMTGLRLAHGAALGASIAALFPLLFFQMLQL